MPITVDDVETLERYLEGVLRRADHHATNVRFVVLTLAGAIVLFKNPERISRFWRATAI